MYSLLASIPLKGSFHNANAKAYIISGETDTVPCRIALDWLSRSRRSRSSWRFRSSSIRRRRSSSWSFVELSDFFSDKSEVSFSFLSYSINF